MKRNQKHRKHRKTLKSRAAKVGLPAGSLVYVGDTPASRTTVQAFEYNAAHCREWRVEDLDQLSPPQDPDTTLWVNLDGLGDAELLRRLGERFGIHTLTIEDVLNTDQRTKLEEFDDFLFIVLKMLSLVAVNGAIQMKMEQVSLILGPNFVISCLEDPGDVFNPVREHIRQNKGKIRKMGADFLIYSLLDALVDGYFLVMEQFGEYLESIEDRLIQSAQSEILQEIHALRNEIILLRKAVWPLREVINALQRGTSSLISPGLTYYFRDVYDHTVAIIDNIESNRDLIASLSDLYLSSVSYQLNVVMKVLTIIATIFIPLTFVTSVYGMNFKYMPELDSPWGYPAVWAVLLIMTLVMLMYFKRQKWL